MARQLIVEIIGDEKSYIRSAERTLAANTRLRVSNTTLAKSFAKTGITADKSAALAAGAAVKSQAAQRERIAATTRFALTAPTPQLKEVAFAQAATQQARLDKELGNVQKATRGSALATAAYGTSVGRTAQETEALSQKTAVAERDLGKIVRGGLSGSGVFSRLGRSLAFASSGFIAVAVGASGIAKSITSAEALEKAQRSLGVAIQHTGGRLRQLLPEYAATAKAAARFGVTQADATTGEARATVITGNAAAAQRAYQEALVISKATGKDFNTVLLATSKGQEGIVTSLRRYGILVDSTTKGTQQFALVMKRFGGQAAANTTELEKLGATGTNTFATIGTDLLPTVNRLAASFAAWLTQMQKSGRLQKDVNDVMHVTGDAVHLVARAFSLADKVTGSFQNTLKLLLGLKFLSLASGWILELDAMAGAWGKVAAAATAAGVAEKAALDLPAIAVLPGASKAAGAGAETVGGAAAGAGFGAALARLLGRGGTNSVVARVGQYTNATESAGAAAAGATSKIARLSRGLGELALIATSPQLIGAAHKVEDKGRNFLTRHLGRPGAALSDLLLPTSVKDFTGVSFVEDVFGGGSRNKPIPLFFSPQFLKFGQRFGPPAPFTPQGFGLGSRPGIAPRGFDSGVKPIPVFKTFQLTGPEQLAQARAALTRSNADDVKAAKIVIARIKRLIDQGHLAGKSLIQALQAEGSALSTLWSAEDAAAQARAARAQAAKARIQAQLENRIDPLKLEVALSRAQALGRPFVSILKQMRASAEAAIRSGRLTLAQQKEAWDQITQLNGQIKDALTSASVTFQVPAKLALALAKDQALGRDDTKDLLKLKRALLNFIKHHRHNVAALTDAYNQLAAVNQQLGSTATSALGLFKQASTKALTAGLGLTAQQRKALRERLAGLGPGGTVSGSGVGAGGFAIDPNTGRPVVLDRHHRRRDTTDGSGGGGGGRRILVESKIDLDVYIDGHHVEASVTKRQQKRKRRNPSQRRGPNAGG